MQGTVHVSSLWLGEEKKSPLRIWTTNWSYTHTTSMAQENLKQRISFQVVSNWECPQVVVPSTQKSTNPLWKDWTLIQADKHSNMPPTTQCTPISGKLKCWGMRGKKCVHLEFLKHSTCFLKKNKTMLFLDLGHSSSIYKYISTMCIIEVSKQLKAWPLLPSGLLTISLETELHVSIWFTFGLLWLQCCHKMVRGVNAHAPHLGSAFYHGLALKWCLYKIRSKPVFIPPISAKLIKQDTLWLLRLAFTWKNSIRCSMWDMRFWSFS